MSRFTIVGIGELLWDFLPAGKEIGGAPGNFAYVAGQLGDRGVVASRIGEDALGTEIRARLDTLGVDTSVLQVDREHATGTVSVQVDPAGQPQFDIAGPVAWDFFELSPAWESMARIADAIYIGTLGQRHPKSKATTQAFVGAARPDALKIFDANLRQNFFSADAIRESLQIVNAMKLNHDELPRVMQMLGLSAPDEVSSAQKLLREFDLRIVCVTRGERGSLLVTRDGVDEHPGFRIEVKDTVGAGDAFTATLVHHLLRGSSLSRINEAANRIGAWVASHSGATPPFSADVLAKSRA